MAVRRPRRRPQAGSFGGTAVAPGGPFAEEELALDLLLPGSTAAGNSTNGGGGGQPAQQQQQLVPLEVTWLRRRGDRVCKEQELASVRCRLGRDAGGPEVVRKLLSPRTGTLEEALVPSPLPPLDTSTTDAGRLVLGKVVYCSHPCLRDDRMCAVCGEVAADLGHAHHGAGGTTRVFVKGGHHVSVSMVRLWDRCLMRLLSTARGMLACAPPSPAQANPIS